MQEKNTEKTSESVVKFFPIILPALAILGAIIQIVIKGSGVVETLLVYLLAAIGIGGIWAFMGHWFKSGDVAKSIGWATGSGFQKEIAMTNLGIGVAGIMCIWFRGDFWMAVVIMYAIFALGAAYGHIQDRYKNNNLAPGNWGPILWLSDIALPLIIICLFIIYRWG
ncbi:MAG: DUF6790 family protein [Patescibacteria group bacterium]|nr:hypothetical protein [Patescibacteria group bacterium]